MRLAGLRLDPVCAGFFEDLSGTKLPIKLCAA